MKRPTLLLLGSAALLITLSTWTSGVLANVTHPAAAFTPALDPGESLVNRPCVVTLDPRYTSKQVIAKNENIVTGLSAIDTVEGVLIRMDANWIVLNEPYYENWIPTSKVIMIHARK